MTTGRYQTEAGFRRALEDRLRRIALETGRPLDRLRKEVALERFMARLAEVAPDGSWALKGGIALIARLWDRARAKRDLDATWRAQPEAIEPILDAVTQHQSRDGFRFEIGDARPLVAETEEGGVRYSVTAILAGRPFERIAVDVNFVPGDSRPIDRVRLRNLLGFAGIDAPEVPVVPIGQHLAEKVHAYCRIYAHASSRPHDILDMLLIAENLPLALSHELADTCRSTFSLRNTAWPPLLHAPPHAWDPVWVEYVATYGVSWRKLRDAFSALERFWVPVFDGVRDLSWNPDEWIWKK
jgi:hypothetical protein